MEEHQPTQQPTQQPVTAAPTQPGLQQPASTAHLHTVLKWTGIAVVGLVGLIIVILLGLFLVAVTVGGVQGIKQVVNEGTGRSSTHVAGTPSENSQDKELTSLRGELMGTWEYLDTSTSPGTAAETGQLTTYLEDGTYRIQIGVPEEDSWEGAWRLVRKEDVSGVDVDADVGEIILEEKEEGKAGVSVSYWTLDISGGKSDRLLLVPAGGNAGGHTASFVKWK